MSELPWNRDLRPTWTDILDGYVNAVSNALTLPDLQKISDEPEDSKMGHLTWEAHDLIRSYAHHIIIEQLMPFVPSSHRLKNDEGAKKELKEELIALMIARHYIRDPKSEIHPDDFKTDIEEHFEIGLAEANRMFFGPVQSRGR